MNPPMYTECPKCGHVLSIPLPDSAACPVCGIYFFKYSQHQTVLSSDTQIESSSFNFRELFESLLAPLDEIDVPTFYGRCLALALLALWGCFLFADDYRVGEIGSSFMHNILLPIHEAGHVLLTPLGTFMTILGGSLFQVMLPLGISIAFIWLNKDNFGAAITLVGKHQFARSRSLHLRCSSPAIGIARWSHRGRWSPRLGLSTHGLWKSSKLATMGGILMLVALSWALTVLWHQRLVIGNNSSYRH
jgi:hypothetical protein